MIPSAVNDAIENDLRKRLGCSLTDKPKLLSNSSLSLCCVFQTKRGQLFVKISKDKEEEMFIGEFNALNAIRKTSTVNAPKPFFYGKTLDHSYLVLEYLNMQPHTSASMAKLGRLLAELHLAPAPTSFGFEVNNTIGTTPQKNPWTKEWFVFFRDCRLRFQLELIEKNYRDSLLQEKGELLLANLAKFFQNIKIIPSLLHGDLWQGNTAADLKGDPLVFDPASYYGHHEAELSIMGMFGGFPSAFYQAYHQMIPKQPGFAERQLCYQLYHYLNHYNIFGPGYRQSCLHILERLSALSG